MLMLTLPAHRGNRAEFTLVMWHANLLSSFFIGKESTDRFTGAVGHEE